MAWRAIPTDANRFLSSFEQAATPVLEQMIRRLEHDELGAFELFLVPIGPDDTGMRYEAVFA